MRANLKYTLSFVAIAVVASVCWYLWGWNRAPQGQTPLVSLTSSNLDQFKLEFNEGADRNRLVLLLSPT
ncbi:MAG: hypothetical protein WBE45_12755 [Terriglobales bacterium]|jgi:hypothetical protein